VRSRRLVLGQNRLQFHQISELIREQRRAEVKSLVLITSQFRQQGELLGGFDTLGDHFQMQAVRQRNDRANDRCVLRAPGHLLDKAAVDFQLINRQAPQVTHARVTGAEIIHRHQNAHAA